MSQTIRAPVDRVFRTAVQLDENHNELREFEPNRRVMVAPITRILSGGHRWLFTDLGGDTTRIDHELELDAHGIFLPMQPLLRANGKKTIRVTAAALARHLGGEDPPKVATR
jgi:hypothetical protein